MTYTKTKHTITLNKYLSYLLGNGILAFGMYNIHSRCAISEGGILGCELLAQYWLHISPSISSLVLNGIFYALGIYVLGRTFLKDSVIAAVLYSLWYTLFEHIGPILPDLSGHLLSASVIGGIFVGVGCGSVVRWGGATGGDDALVLVVNKLWHIPVFFVYCVSDICVLLLSLSYIPAKQILYSLLSVMISSGIVDLLCRIN